MDNRMSLTLAYCSRVGTHTSMADIGYNAMPPRVLSSNYSLGDPVYASPFVSITILCCRLSFSKLRSKASGKTVWIWTRDIEV
jgi:hypothetical protein